jgi:Right handed beta helix region
MPSKSIPSSCRIFPTDGIKFNSGGTLTVRDSVIRNFSNDGISFFPIAATLSQLFVSNTLVSDNGSEGIWIYPDGSAATTGVLDHVAIENNADHGLFVITGTQNINLTVGDSVSANNGGSGIIASSTGGTPVSIMVRNSTIANNGVVGLLAFGTGATILVTRSTITGNASGAMNAWADRTFTTVFDGASRLCNIRPNVRTGHEIASCQSRMVGIE